MIKIIKSTEPMQINNVILTIYGNPSSGKTSFAYTADNVILFDCDNGSHRAKRNGATVAVTKWCDIAEVTEKDLADFSTVIIDTVGNMCQLIIAHIETTNPAKAKNGMLLYGEVAKIYKAFITKIKSWKKDLVFISHYVEEKKGDSVITRLDIAGKSKNDVQASSDLLGYMLHQDGRRELNFNPIDGRIAKNTGDFPVFDLSNGHTHTLGEIIADLKIKINSLSEDATQKLAIFNAGLALIDKAVTAGDFNTLMTDEIISKDATLKKHMVKTSEAKGIKFDKEQKLFVGITKEDDFEIDPAAKAAAESA